jgi:hypothetical protein
MLISTGQLQRSRTAEADNELVCGGKLLLAI